MCSATETFVPFLLKPVVLGKVVDHLLTRRVEHEVALLEGDPPVAVDVSRRNLIL